MNPSIHLLAFTAALTLHASAADWEIWKKTPAQIEVIDMTPVPLAAGAGADKKGWAKVPEQLTKNGATVYMPNKDAQGVTNIKVTGDGYLMLACNYEYQGNPSGNWGDEVWDEKKFKSKGWHLLTKNEAGGILTKADNKDEVIFIKLVKKGDTFRIRCNKYDPPYPILLTP